MLEQNFEIRTGETLSFTWIGEDVNGPYDLTGWKAYIAVKSRREMTWEEAEIKKEVTITSPTTGTVVVTLLPSETITLSERKYQYAFRLVTDTGVVADAAGGIIDVKTGVVDKIA